MNLMGPKRHTSDFLANSHSSNLDDSLGIESVKSSDKQSSKQEKEASRPFRQRIGMLFRSKAASKPAGGQITNLISPSSSQQKPTSFHKLLRSAIAEQ